jgi:multidrug efflux pump subunit AcrA (membrane-fusion protein)
MKDKIINIDEFSDSRELMSANPKPFVLWLIYIILAIAVSFLIWAYFSRIDISVQESGVVQSGDTISIIKNVVAGQISKVCVDEGTHVKKGDVLYSIDASSLVIQQNYDKNTISQLKNDDLNLTKYEQSIQQGKNLFDNNNPTEVDYYNMYQQYSVDLESTQQQIGTSNVNLIQSGSDAKTSEQLAATQLTASQNILRNQQLLLNSVQQVTDLFTSGDDLQFKSQYNDYVQNLSQLQTTYNQDVAAYNATLQCGRCFAV